MHTSPPASASLVPESQSGAAVVALEQSSRKASHHHYGNGRDHGKPDYLTILERTGDIYLRYFTDQRTGRAERQLTSGKGRKNARRPAGALPPPPAPRRGGARGGGPAARALAPPGGRGAPLRAQRRSPSRGGRAVKMAARRARRPPSRLRGRDRHGLGAHVPRPLSRRTRPASSTALRSSLPCPSPAGRKTSHGAQAGASAGSGGCVPAAGHLTALPALPRLRSHRGTQAELGGF